MHEHTPATSDPFIEAHTRPNKVRDMYPRVQQYQAMINSLQRDSEQVDEFTKEVLQELDDNCGHMNELVDITGWVTFRSADVRSLDPTTGHIESSAFEEEQVFVENYRARSLGYTAIRNLDDPYGIPSIRHLVATETAPLLHIPNVGRYSLTRFGLLNPDESVEVRCASDMQGVHLPLLEYYVDDLLDLLEETVDNAKNQSDKLRRLSRIDLTPWTRALRDGEIALELTKYLQELCTFKSSVHYRVAGITDLTVQMDERVESCQVEKGSKITGHVHGLGLITYPDRPPVFGLSMRVPMTDDTIRQAYAQLTGRMYVTELDSLQINRPD